MTIPLQRGLTYGPVNSRRLGRSLGINLLPLHLKVCTFNCVYCQYGWTRIHDWRSVDRDQWPAVDQVVREVSRVLQDLSPPPAYLTFSGNGEPTLHPDFPEIAEKLRDVRDQLAPATRIALLSNSTTVGSPAILKAISRLDVPIMKLDCGDEECFQRYNRPGQGITLTQIVSGLSELKNVNIQTLFSEGEEGNYSENNLDSWIDKLHMISPVLVQIYTLDRGYPSEKIRPVTAEQLTGIKNRLDKENICARVFIRDL